MLARRAVPLFLQIAVPLGVALVIAFAVATGISISTGGRTLERHVRNDLESAAADTLAPQNGIHRMADRVRGLAGHRSDPRGHERAGPPAGAGRIPGDGGPRRPPAGRTAREPGEPAGRDRGGAPDGLGNFPARA